MSSKTIVDGQIQLGSGRLAKTFPILTDPDRGISKVTGTVVIDGVRYVLKVGEDGKPYATREE